MTRETKVGVVVATAFVGLIGGVFVVKYLDPAARPNGAPHVGETTPDVKKPDADVTNLPPPSSDPPGTVAVLPAAPAALPPMTPVPTAPPSTGSVVPLTPFPGTTPLVMVPDGASVDIFAHFNQTKSARCLIGSGLLTKASTLMLATEKGRQKTINFDPNLRVAAADVTPPGPVVVPMAPLAPPDLPMAGGISLPQVAPMAPPKPADLPAPMSQDPVPLLPVPGNGPTAPVPDAPKPMGGVTIKFDLPEPPKSADTPAKPAAPPKPDPMPMSPPPVPVPLTTKPDDPLPLSLPKPPDTPAKPADPPPLVVPKPADVGLPKKPDEPLPAPGLPKPPDPKPAPPVDFKPVPAVVDIKPAPIPALPADPKPVPMLGSPVPMPENKVEPAASFDPSRARPAGPREDADSYEEEWHPSKDGETLATISKAFYYTERYEQALRLYNLDRQGSDNLRQERPVLRGGQQIRIPPARILERKYPAAIPGLKVATPVGGSAGAATPPPAALGPVTADRSDGGNSAMEYEVTKPGMTLQAIAKEVLGGTDQWNRIFLLNRWVNSAEPVPVGAKIYVPRPVTR